MANYTQQCRVCHINIEGTGDDICYRCLSRAHDSVVSELERLKARISKAEEDAFTMGYMHALEERIKKAEDR